MTESMLDAVTPTEMMPTDDPEAFAVAFVQAAVDLYKTEGRDAAITYHKAPANIDGQWYVFIVDANDMFVAHPAAPTLVGKSINEVPGLDGTLIGLDIAMPPEEGHWTEYLWPNPENNKLELKRTWSIRHDGYVFASGYYEPWSPDPATVLIDSKADPEAFAHAFVLAAVARYESEGLDATAAYYNAPASVDGQWYVFITDANDTFVSHAPMQELVGTDLKDVMGLDGSALGAEIAKATGTGHWIEYLWPNPESGMNEMKRTWAIRHDGYLFASGYYKPAAEDATPAVEGSMPEGN
ncbi:hypothetical protein F4Z99_19015 [Candidatus Poribacteria bacterium]|nr:hypothetical protein [Candidatus Poribacteria bacterium]